MAGISLRPEWHLTLTSDELVLILRGLRGKLNTPTLIEKAEQLGDKLGTARAHSTKQMVEQADGILASIASKQETTDGH